MYYYNLDLANRQNVLILLYRIEIYYLVSEYGPTSDLILLYRIEMQQLPSKLYIISQSSNLTL